MPTKEKSTSLFGKLSFFLAGAVLVCGTLAMTSLIYLTYKIQMTERAANLEAITSTIGKLISRPLSVGDYVLVEHYLSREGLPSFIQDLTVTDQLGDVIARQANDTFAGTCRRVITTSFDIASSGTVTIAHGGPAHGSLKATAGVCDINDSAIKLSVVAFVLGVALIGVVMVISRFTIRSVLKPFYDAVSLASSTACIDNAVVTSAPAEIKPLLSRMRELREQFVQSEAAIKVGEFAAQVAHDIRPPLAALDVFLGDLTALPAQKREPIRIAIGRIRDIANQMLAINKGATAATGDDSETEGQALLSSMIDCLVSEKRGQYRSRHGIVIDVDWHPSTYGSFVSVNRIAIRRAVSNLIDNAVEAISDKGSVRIELSCEGDRATLSVVDTGRGIPAEIRSQLGKRGATFGKSNGSGLGLAQVYATVEGAGGSVAIVSEEGRGTKVTLTLPLTKAPAWFRDAVTIPAGSAVMILDDDSSVHDIWRERLGKLGVELVSFSGVAEFEAWLADGEGAEPAVYLIDYEIVGSDKNGLDVIEDHKLASQSILITSRYHEPQILKRSQALGVQLIPKGLIGLVPLSTCALEKMDAILVDDDALVRTVWESSGDRREIGVRRTDHVIIGQGKKTPNASSNVCN